MRVLAAYVFCMVIAGVGTGSLTGQDSPGIQKPGPGENHFSIHNLRPAHQITLGAGAKVGILGHSFGLDSHPELYHGGHVFPGLDPYEEVQEETHHGYWMAMALREVAPEAEIYPLVLPTEDGGPLVEAIVEALDWAVKHGLDVVTYCGGGISEADQDLLDRAVERAVAAGVVVVFLGYSHPLNLLPGDFSPTPPDTERPPDFQIFTRDCANLLAGQVVTFMETDDDAIQRDRPFLGRPNAGTVTAGLVALLRSVDPEATPEEIKRVLVESSRPMEYRGLFAARVPDAFQAISSVSGVPSKRGGASATS